MYVLEDPAEHSLHSLSIYFHSLERPRLLSLMVLLLLVLELDKYKPPRVTRTHIEPCLWWFFSLPSGLRLVCQSSSLTVLYTIVRVYLRHMRIMDPRSSIKGNTRILLNLSPRLHLYNHFFYNFVSNNLLIASSNFSHWKIVRTCLQRWKWC